MRTRRERLKRRRAKEPSLWRALAPSRVPLAIGAAAAIATDRFSDSADPDALNHALTTLITMNAVVVGLVYVIAQSALSLSANTAERDSYTAGVAAMAAFSLLGVLAGIVHLAWGVMDLLPLATFCLVGAPALLPVLAAQEHRAQKAEAVQAAQSLTGDEEDIEEQDTPAGEAASEDSGLLRLRHREFVADPSDPFANDVLGREPQVKAFCSVLAGIDAPTVLSLDAGWGTGKTAFVKMCAAWMRSDAFVTRGEAVAEFNAWTQGYTGEPLKDIVEAVTSQITDAGTERRKRIAKHLAQQAARIASGGLINEATFEVGEGPRRETVKFKNTLRNFVSTGGGRLVVFIDELDRCRPDYAIGVLEQVRHLFDVEGVVVVLAMNREALDHAVGALHGSQDTAERYMRRFVDQATRLPEPNNETTRAFLEHLYDETGISERMKHNSLTRLIFEVLSQPTQSSLRDLEQDVHRVAMVFSSIPPSFDDQFDTANPMWAWEQTAMTLMILRQTSRRAYDRFISGYDDAFVAGQALRAITNWGTPLVVAPNVMERMELVLLLAKRNGREPMLNQEFWEQYERADRGGDMHVLQELYGEFLGRIFGNEPEIEHLAGLIEMTVYDPPEEPCSATILA